MPFLDITREALRKFVKSRGDASGAATFEGACDQLGVKFVKKNGWIPTGFFQYNGIGLANGLYRRIRKDEGRAKSEPFVQRVTEEVHKHHSSHSAATIASYKGWRVANMSADDPGQHTIHSLYYCTATHELDANLLRSVLGTLVSLNAPSVGPVQQAYAILLSSLQDNGELWDEKVKTRLKSGVSSHHAGGFIEICARLTAVDCVGAWLDMHLGDPNVLALVIAALSWGTPQRNDGGRQRFVTFALPSVGDGTSKRKASAPSAPTTEEPRRSKRGKVKSVLDTPPANEDATITRPVPERTLKRKLPHAPDATPGATRRSKRGKVPLSRNPVMGGESVLVATPADEHKGSSNSSESKTTAASKVKTRRTWDMSWLQSIEVRVFSMFFSCTLHLPFMVFINCQKQYAGC